MFRYKSNKQAIIIAALAILICLVCLTGATFALFTNDKNDGTIGIIATAGDIEVDIVDDITGESLVGEVLYFQKSGGKASVLFEPGATFYTQGFKIVNEGNIPIKFRLYISEDEDIDSEEFHSAFEVWIATGTKNPDEMQRLTEFFGSLAVDSATDETYYLFVKMKETAGNEFQNKEYDGIGVTVYAVQDNGNIN